LVAAESQTAFISYSREDSEFALRLAEDLKAAGAAVWLDQLDIAPGARWARAVEEALAACPRMLVILSPSSANSTNVDDEVSFALEEKKAVIPVLYRDCKIPFRLRPFQFVDFRGDHALGLKTLLRALPAELAPARVSPASKEIPPAFANQSTAEPGPELQRTQEQTTVEPSAVTEGQVTLPAEQITVSKETEAASGPANGENSEIAKHPVTEEKPTIPSEDTIQPEMEIHSEPREDTPSPEPGVGPTGKSAQEKSIQTAERVAPAVSGCSTQGLSAPQEQLDLRPPPAEPVKVPIPVRLETGHDDRKAVGESEKARPAPVSLFLSRYSARIKMVTVVCGVLVVGVILYWAWTASHSGWRRQTSGVTETLMSVDFATPESGWAVGNKGVILHTENKGQTWKRQNSGSDEDLRSVVFTSLQLGWAVSNSGSILHTADGGEKWTKQINPGIDGPTSVAFATPESGWVVGHGGGILHTANGGNTWEAQTSGVNTILSSITFVSPQSGWVVGIRGVILHTENGGVTWTKQISGTDKELNSVSFATAQLGWAVGEDGIVLHTEDGGGTWMTQTQITGTRTGYLACVVFPTPQLGWAAGYDDGMGIIAHTGDGGVTWKKHASGMKSWPLWLTFPTSQSGWAVGLDGTILHWEE
jgi:photosystem II stability/assembly factor-like uncharacterized protein